MTGVQRAAVLLLSLGESDAAEVLKHMDPKEVQKIGIAMATMTGISRDQVERVMDDFNGELAGKTSLGVGADDYIRNVLIQALGADKAGGLIDRILLGRNTTGLDTLKWMDPRAVADLVRNEHPQIIAIVMAHLDSDQAAEALKLLPERTRADVLLRIATLDGIPPNALSELNDIMERQFSGNQNLKSSNVGGIKVAANILNFLDTGPDQGVLGEIGKIDADLASKIQDLMFVFDNLVDLDDRGLQTLLREVSGERLGLALRGADTKVREKITRNMSQRAAEILLEDMEARGPVRLADVEAAQKEILTIVRRLADEGAISLGGAGAEAMV
ncbi:flagellar motor switch protein FliG [Xanthomonas hortorum pv. vitians]|uniref:Flagellar motor switch protein FliG n=1 Tax=Xanthomonas hortorum pv. vitians TaxID=83224 RepID=A0A6V7E844_9XANT|nr:flagellar motor switch protein FliG [Xanthomonas hortorum]APP84956.1 flagellar motor switch protein FliG [Xanthomonas hortorum pv. gardneri]ASW45091.1 flagellar motor switch protein FliG [Xanthomonas hortorum]MCC8495495.1 flagellar motor switch protein FliG [Xanthomonas hortorum pv. gardneri]MCC8554517.1 flagellar motor switch protein FliG [Xanthomonas hortorum pv. gardneri]MCE4283199.1 flagellar motor switch protein FliG [Xanthomonas hortorum pv. vitians]